MPPDERFEAIEKHLNATSANLELLTHRTVQNAERISTIEHPQAENAKGISELRATIAESRKAQDIDGEHIRA